MFCKNCGEKINDNAEICIHCGVRIKDTPIAEKAEYKENKTTLGFWLGVLIGLIGLIIGICSYPQGTVSRTTFLKGWLYSLIVPAVLIFVNLIIILGVAITY